MRVNVFSGPVKTEVEVQHRGNHYFLTVSDDGLRIFGLVQVEHPGGGMTMERKILWSDLRQETGINIQNRSIDDVLQAPRPPMTLEEEGALHGFKINSESV